MPDSPETDNLSPEETALAELLQAAYEQEEVDIASVDELLYQLHSLMAGKGREGRFTPYLRDVLGWTMARPDKAARRRIARHRFRAGLIDHDEYQRVMGNTPTSGPLRPAWELPTDDGTCPDDEEPAPSAQESPAESFTFEIEEDNAALPLVPASVSQEEAELASAELQHLGVDAAAVVLQRRFVLPVAKMDWFKAGLKLQMRRHGAATHQELLWKLTLCGPKVAKPGDEWDETYDEILFQVGCNPKLAYHADPDYEEEADD